MLSKYGNRQRGTTLLYITGILSVLTILLVGLSEQTARTTSTFLSACDRVRVEWAIRAGKSYALAEPDSLRAVPEKSISLAPSGSLTFASGAETSNTIQITARVPEQHARVTSSFVVMLH